MKPVAVTVCLLLTLAVVGTTRATKPPHPTLKATPISNAPNVPANASDSNDVEIPAGRSIGEFLTPEGRFDLEAARRSSYEGPLDMKGFESELDTTAGEPVFRPASPASPADHPDDIYWDNSISPSLAGICGPVYAATIFNGQLVVGGWFRGAGKVLASNVASWDGTSWSPLGSGADDRVYALTVYNGNLIAGGHFIKAGGITADYIASWDGASWSPLGDRDAEHCYRTNCIQHLPDCRGRLRCSRWGQCQQNSVMERKHLVSSRIRHERCGQRPHFIRQ